MHVHLAQYSAEPVRHVSRMRQELLIARVTSTLDTTSPNMLVLDVMSFASNVKTAQSTLAAHVEMMPGFRLMPPSATNFAQLDSQTHNPVYCQIPWSFRQISLRSQ